MHMENKNIDRFPFFAESFLVDCKGRVRPSTLCSSMLSAANRHAETRGFGATDSLGWVIARMALHVERIPLQKEKLVIETWVKSLYHGFTDRCVRMVDANGCEVVSMIATFAMIDLKTRTAADLNGDIGLRINECIVPEKLATMARMPSMNRLPVEGVVFKRSPHYSDVDINGHMNSIRYLDHILDALPMDYVNGHTLSDLVVAYIQEGEVGELLAYGIKELEENRYLVQVTKECGTIASRFELKFRSE